jgi:hypothetical protein
MPTPPTKPTLILGSFRAFVEYKREHPEMRLVHVQRPRDADGYEAERVITVDHHYPYQLYLYAKTRVR